MKKAGWKIYFYPKAEITHWGGASIKKRGFFSFWLSRAWNKSRDYYFRKHFGGWTVAILWLSELGKILIVFGLLFLIYQMLKILLSLPAKFISG